MKRFVHVGFNAPQSNERIKHWIAVFKPVPDWFRYTSTNWILWTSKDPEQIWKLLEPSIAKDERVLICYLDMYAGKQGWLQQDAWDWMNKPRYDVHGID